MNALRAMMRSRHGGTAAEFGLLTPLLLSFMIGTVDLGRFLWTCNRAEKATQMGVRFAVTNDIVPSGLATYDFAVTGGIPQGDPIPSSSFTSALCSETSGGTVSCTCVPATCPGGNAYSKPAFDNIVTQMKRFYPELTANHVQINYNYAGLGYAGDPNGIQISPLVTVKLTGMTFTPMLFRFFGNSSITLPAYSASLTLEDGKTG
jgi:Flp pilus assembly protein TadG